MSQRIKTLQYQGGKSCANPAGRWIAGLLPWEYNTTYVEPFAGMLGILTQRKPVVNEVVNDINGDITNWWIQVRDNHEELARLIAQTPRSRIVFKEAWREIKDEKTTPLKRALALHIIVNQSIMHAAGCEQWAPVYSPHRMSIWVNDEIKRLSERIRRVYIESRDALEVLERVGMEKDAVVYCDPPYHTADNRPYGKGKDGTDWNLMEKLLKAQKGRVAVSGYAHEWDCLGWHRHEFIKAFTVLQSAGNREGTTRTEVLWTNFALENRQATLNI